MPPRTSQKRAPSSSSSFSSSALPTKKTRFADPDSTEDFAEQVEEALEGSTRKGRVRVEGYESDSSDEGEGVRRKSAGGGEEEEDMFAMAEDTDEVGKKKKGEEGYMRLGDIEGQEFHNNESEDEDEDEEEDEESKEKKEMGYALSSFNMREEMEEGKFTEDGMYVRTKDEHARHDAWLADVNSGDIKKARRRKRELEKRKEEREEEEEREVREKGGVHALERELLALLRRGETSLEALGRLGRGKKKSQKHNASSTASTSTDVERITHLASQIMALGDTDVYSKTYEELVRSVRSSGIVPRDWQPPSADKMFEYRWSSAHTAGQAQPAGQAQTTSQAAAAEVFGPFGEDELMGWFKARYFGEGGEKIDVREVGGNWAAWDEVFP
ncbi:hypothetical protein CYLTODRAFT_418203 [Cylindrobasidium torrendii FP15055 ss-10]|uniref:GYF domain-containing protein n=1 Tax=Cylindrobasidium torrendii FP15055 ss-10 TaxID=1314674 RepID=A0A0D7BP86_9AGAR|nr:hypothetical protein CYLTODRAFT_418203 [Cylindrobasidium torrendii FP15055 ss-10]